MSVAKSWVPVPNGVLVATTVRKVPGEVENGAFSQ